MRKKLLHYYQGLSLTGNQSEAITYLEDFFHGPQHAFVLKGYAGTGKTFMLSRLPSYFRESYIPFHYIAPTGRAAKILRKKTNCSASTIHSMLYKLDVTNSQLELDDDEYKLCFELRENTDPSNTVYIIDEASMVSDMYSESEALKFGSGRLLTDLMSYVNCQTTKRKIIFIGDYAQLAPVGSNMSPALSIRYLTQSLHLQCIEYEMTDVFRQAQDSGVLQLSLGLRNALKQERYDQFVAEPNQRDVFHSSILDSVHTFCSRWSVHDEESAIMIAQTNSSVHEYNQAIRERLGYRPNELQAGDQLLVVKNTIVNGIPLFNGDFIRVKQSGRLEVRSIRLRGVPDEVPLHFRTVTATWPGMHGEMIEMELKILENLLYSTNRELTRLELRALMADFRMRHPGLHPKHELFLEVLRSDPYVGALLVKFGYAITGHKSQGGEWKHVIVDLHFSKSIRCEEYFRWSYTAITRARNELFLVRTPGTQFTKEQVEPSDALEELTANVTERLGQYNFVAERMDSRPYQLQFAIKTPSGNHRVQIYYNKRFDITSSQIQSGTGGLDERILQMLLESLITKHSAAAEPAEAVSKGQLQQEVVDLVVPTLQAIEPSFTFQSASEHQHCIKVKGLIQHREFVLNIYFNQRQVFTKMHVEKGRELLSGLEWESQMQHVLRNRIPY